MENIGALMLKKAEYESVYMMLYLKFLKYMLKKKVCGNINNNCLLVLTL